ncbi:hypothetical protein APR04_004454 [Promicromonospora umidemergens]|uniref:Tetracyclin repressor-like C-terminal domain-containing protein n=1 Tax=Promicromonospora umidemergens TaxID=629679 RepID=A0ABP8WYC2_9MICO|nr:hypothetical protein [Promicromonospora umidemergens]MCP2285519.1 hypothetical protein [Promicromonospora umidemergens]
MSLAAGIGPTVGGDGERGVFGAVQEQIALLVGEELRRLDRRTSLTPTERAEVAVVLHRLIIRLALPTLVARKRDPRVTADLLGLSPSAGEGAA